MKNIFPQIKTIKWTEYLLFGGQTIIIYLLVNFAQFLFHLIKVDNIYSWGFDNGVFFLNGNQIGHEMTASIGFILLLFVIQVVYVYRNKKSYK